MAPRRTPETAPVVPFEECLAELQSVVSDLEDGALGLEASLARFETGIRLLRACYSFLESAEAKVELLTRSNGDSTAETIPFDNAATYTSAHESSKGAESPAQGASLDAGLSLF